MHMQQPLLQSSSLAESPQAPGTIAPPASEAPTQPPSAWHATDVSAPASATPIVRLSRKQPWPSRPLDFIKLGICLSLPTITSLAILKFGSDAVRLMFLTVLALSLWTLKPFSISAEHAALIMLFLLVVSGTNSFEVVFSSFGTRAVWLVFVGMAMSNALKVSGFPAIVAEATIRYSKSKYHIMWFLNFSGACLALLIPSGAVRTTLVFPIADEVARLCGLPENPPESANGRTAGSNVRPSSISRAALFLAIAMPTIFCGVSIPTDLLPNIAVVGVLDNAGYHMTWAYWFYHMCPFFFFGMAIVCLAISYFLLFRRDDCLKGFDWSRAMIGDARRVSYAPWVAGQAQCHQQPWKAGQPPVDAAEDGGSAAVGHRMDPSNAEELEMTQLSQQRSTSAEDGKDGTLTVAADVYVLSSPSRQKKRDGAGRWPGTAAERAEGRTQMYITLFVMMVACGFWCTDSVHHIDMVVIGLAAVVCLYMPVVGAVRWERIRDLNYPLMFYVACVVAFGQAISESPFFTNDLTDFLTSGLTKMTTFQKYYSIALLCFPVALLNLAMPTAGFLLPILLGRVADLGLEIPLVGLSVGMGCSFLLFPYQSTPLMVAYSYNQAPLRYFIMYTLSILLVSMTIFAPSTILWWMALS